MKTSIPIGPQIRSPLWALILAVVGVTVVTCDTSDGGPSPLPDQRQSAARIQEIASLQVARTGIVTISTIPLTPAGGQQPSVHRIDLQSPGSVVEDVDIRGLVNGNGKYVFNQGTAYHMRIGRRFDGPRNGEFELKRSLIRWKLPALPPSARVVSAKLTFWVESHAASSPLHRIDAQLPLHVFAYPLNQPWIEGEGGVGHDDFSAPAPGEATWMDARSGQLSWPAPGALAVASDPGRRYDISPVAVGRVDRDDTTLVLAGPRLTALVDARLASGSVDLLLKLEDDEEDRWGTEIALLTSEFGTELDYPGRRPRLELEISLPAAGERLEHHFALEPGMEDVLPVVTRRERGPYVFDLEVAGDDREVAPVVLVRGGPSSGEGRTWVPLVDGLVRDWQWWQVKIIGGGRPVILGDTFSLDLHATWVSPGPREDQVPELVLIAPSGDTIVINGVAIPGLRYRLAVVPRELGLWRFGWSFRPSQHHLPGSQKGHGTFFVRIAGNAGDSLPLQDVASGVAASAAERTSNPQVQARTNALLRALARSRRRAGEPSQWADDLMTRLRQPTPP